MEWIIRWKTLKMGIDIIGEMWSIVIETYHFYSLNVSYLTLTCVDILPETFRTEDQTPLLCGHQYLLAMVIYIF